MKRPAILDPRHVPLDPSDLQDAPALPPDRLTIDALRKRFARPGHWSPEFVDDSFRLGDAPVRAAAVLVPLVERPEGVNLFLTLRSETLSNHGGQVAFPGGRVDDSDASLADAALRETREEIGIAPSAIEVLGELPVYRTGTGYAVTPVVGLVDPVITADSLVLQPAEVADAFEVPLTFLMDPSNHQRRLFRWHQDGQEHERRFFTMPWRPDPARDREYFIWGATAAMLRNLYRFLAAR
ncbi:MAG: CoA pyrophosphatase [Burkholderiaceae bacterium]|nr:CoA pyrophosphatase [Burkholderiaceae bacterium]